MLVSNTYCVPFPFYDPPGTVVALPPHRSTCVDTMPATRPRAITVLRDPCASRRALSTSNLRSVSSPSALEMHSAKETKSASPLGTRITAGGPLACSVWITSQQSVPWTRSANRLRDQWCAQSIPEHSNPSACPRLLRLPRIRRPKLPRTKSRQIHCKISTRCSQTRHLSGPRPVHTWSRTIVAVRTNIRLCTASIFVLGDSVHTVKQRYGLLE